MKKAALLLGILFVTCLVTQAQEDIFKKHGVTKEPLTLSKGKYKETFYNEEVMQVGTVLINTLTNKVVKFLEEDTTKLAYRAETTSRFLTVDPLAEKYYSWSPYVYVGNNPILRTDPTGMDWYQDSDGSYQYYNWLNKDNKDAFALLMKLRNGKDVSYVGENHQIKDGKGNVTEDYRNDGSIMYANESDAYSRMTTNSQKTGNEEMSVITDNGVLVLPSWANSSGEGGVSKYGYSFKGGDLVDPVSKKTLNTVATAHTHPSGAAMGNDDYNVAMKTQGKPAYALMLGDTYYPKGHIQGLIVPRGQASPQSINVSGKEAPHMTVYTISNSFYGYSLKDFTKKRKK